MNKMFTAYEKKILIIILMIAAIIAGFFAMSGCASVRRLGKTISSDFKNGLQREIIVYDAVGNELFRQTGKFDVDYSEERVLYDDEQGNRHVIYFKTGTVVINEFE